MLSDAEKNRMRVKEWRKKNPEKYKAISRRFQRRKYAEDADFRERKKRGVKKWRRENVEHYENYWKSTHQERKEWVDNYKKTLSCKRCGVKCSSNPELFHFHHPDEEVKKFSIGASMLRSKKSLIEEIKKCDFYCRECHLTLHAQKRAINCYLIKGVALKGNYFLRSLKGDILYGCRF